MDRIILTTGFALLLGSCGGSGDSNSIATSEFNPDLVDTLISGEPGGDITTIAGLWDGSTSNGDTTDVVYWNFAANGFLQRYDYQQDGVADASGENCYIVSDAITVTPEGGDDYSISDVAVSAVVSDDSLSVSFLEADKNDLDEDGDSDETPVFTWSRLDSPVLEDLNSCALSNDNSSTQNASLTPPASNTVNSVTGGIDGQWLSSCTSRDPEITNQYEQEFLVVEGQSYQRTINYYQDSDYSVPGDISFLRVSSTDLQYPEGSVQTALGAASLIELTLPTIDFDRSILTDDEASLFDPALFFMIFTC